MGRNGLAVTVADDDCLVEVPLRGAQPMALIDWGPNFELGVGVIDEQHLGLVRLINRLHEVNAGERNPSELQSLFAELLQCTKTHFGTEEDLMRRYGYSRSAEHQLEHRKFVKVLSAFKTKYEGGQTAVSVAMMRFLRDWLANHILESDMQFGRALRDLGVH
jgi:hemerythrin-like metal-binding protein